MIQPTITGTTHTLPFDKLSPADFERLCLWLVQREGFDRAEHLGAAGKEQGRDIVAWREGMQWAFQCKRVRNFYPREALAEVEKVLCLPEAERPAALVFIVTCDVSAKTRQQARDRCEQARLDCQFWTGTELDAKIKQYQDILEEFFRIAGHGTDLDREIATYLRSFVHFIEEEQKPWGMGRWVPLVAFQSQEDAPVRRVRIRMHSALNDDKSLLPQSVPLLGEPVDLFSLLDQGQRVVILGEPGSGKTFVARRWLWEVTHMILNGRCPYDTRLSVPIYVNAGEYRSCKPNGTPERVIPFLKDYLGRFGFSRTIAAHLETLLEDGRIIVVFDGLNQMPFADYYRRLQLLVDFASREYPANRFVFTCRTLHYDEMLDYQIVVLADLTPERMQQFLKVYLGRPAPAERAFLDLQANPDLARHCSRPFILQMYAAVFQARQEVPVSRAELFKEFVHLQLDQIGFSYAEMPERRLSESVARGLAELAFAMCDDGKFGASVSFGWISRHTDLGEQIQNLQREDARGILDISVASQRMAFSHHILQEYFAALELQGQLNQGRNVEGVLRDPLWEEIVILCAGLSPNPEGFIRRVLEREVKRLYPVLLAGKIVYENNLDKTAIGEWVIDTLSEILTLNITRIPPSIRGQADAQRIYAVVDVIMVLSNFQNHPTAVDSICQALQIENAWVLEVAVHSLASSPPDSLAQQHLLEFIRALPWGPRTAFSDTFHGEENQTLYRMKNQLEPLLLRKIDSLPEPLQSELRFRRAIRKALDWRLWIILFGAVVLPAIVLSTINHFYNTWQLVSPGPFIAWFTEERLFQVVVPIAYAPLVLLVYLYLAIAIRDNWDTIRKIFSLRVLREMLTTKRGRFALILMGLALALWLLLMNSQVWIAELAGKVMESSLFDSAVSTICLPVALFMMLVVMFLMMLSQIWFYVQFKHRRVGQIIFENRMPDGHTIGEPRKGMALVAFASVCMMMVFCPLSMMVGTRFLTTAMELLVFVLASTVLGGVPAAIVVIQGVRQRRRLTRQRRHLRELLSHLNASGRMNTTLILELAQLAADKRQHYSIRVQALAILERVGQPSNVVLELIEPLINSTYPEVRAAAARAAYQIRHRLRKSVLGVYSHDTKR